MNLVFGGWVLKVSQPHFNYLSVTLKTRTWFSEFVDLGHWLSCISPWFLLIHKLHGGGTGSLVQRPEAASLQL